MYPNTELLRPGDTITSVVIDGETSPVVFRRPYEEGSVFSVLSLWRGHIEFWVGAAATVVQIRAAAETALKASGG